MNLNVITMYLRNTVGSYYKLDVYISYVKQVATRFTFTDVEHIKYH